FPQIVDGAWIINDRQEGNEDLVETRFDRAVHQVFPDSGPAQLMKSEEEQLVAETQRLFLVFRRQVDGHVVSKAGLAHRLGQTPALQRLVFKKPPSRHD